MDRSNSIEAILLHHRMCDITVLTVCVSYITQMEREVYVD